MDIRTHYEMDFQEDLWLALVRERPVIHCDAGHMVYLQDTPATCFYFLKEGRVKSFIQSEDGGERMLHLYRKGDIFGHSAFFDELPRVSSAVTLLPSALVAVDRELVEDEFSRDPSLAVSMIRYLARTVRFLSDQLDDMAFLSAGQRLARQLLRLQNQRGQVFAKQEELAYAISTSRVTVSRSLAEFASQGWIILGYREIQICKADALNHYSRHLK